VKKSIKNIFAKYGSSVVQLKFKKKSKRSIAEICNYKENTNRCCKKWEKFSIKQNCTFVYCPECGKEY